MHINRRQALPSSFLSRQQKRKKVAKGSKTFIYDRDILCLPYNYMVGNSIPIPCSKHMRNFLASNGLIGKIRLSSSMTEEEIMSEIRSVFSIPMRNESNFGFKILQPSGGSSKSLSVPALSSSFKWTASAIAGKNSKMPIYVLASDDLKVITTS